MRVFLFLITAFAMLVGMSYPQAHAQTREPPSFHGGVIQKYSYRANPVFEGMVRDILNERSLRMSFSKFRRQYALTSQYAPIADKVVDDMLKHAYNAQNAVSPEASQASYDAFNVLVMKHMANLKVVLQTLSLARTDERFGRVKILEWVRNGLIQNLMISGNGRTLAEAYDVITLEEEVVLLSRLGLKPTETIPKREGIVYYNMHDYIDEEKGRRATVFVNTTYPMQFLEAKSKGNGRAPINPGW